MTQAESQTRIDLAACYRLVDLFGWSDLINTRITARVPGPQNHFLINRFGMLYDEITASSLVKIDVDGNKVEPSDDEVNSGGFAIPSTIHMARPDINCVIHTHTVAGCAVSMQKGGLLPLNQHALQVIGDVAYHDYEGTGRSLEERERFLADFGDKHMRNGIAQSRPVHRRAQYRRSLYRDLPDGACLRDATRLSAVGRRVQPALRRGGQRGLCQVSCRRCTRPRSEQIRLAGIAA
jgi:ribulose-5-phosphate 4-epimerase/fuculose-1-phosphate aldolase